MNERIRQLWSQAGGHYDSGNQHTWPQYTIDDPKKFAELIVKECMNVLDPGEHQLIARFHARKWLAEHFGVEE
jgi:hypothetical protein